MDNATSNDYYLANDNVTVMNVGIQQQQSPAPTASSGDETYRPPAPTTTAANSNTIAYGMAGAAQGPVHDNYNTGYIQSQLSQPTSTITQDDDEDDREKKPSPTNIPLAAYYQDLLNDTTAATAISNNYNSIDPLTPSEIAMLRVFLQRNDLQSLAAGTAHISLDSDYPEYGESTHAWAVFADHPQKRAGFWERVVGTVIIMFQLFAYRLFATEAIGDFQSGVIPVMISHQTCVEEEAMPYDNFTCEAEFTNTMDAFVAFFMLGIFLTPDMLQAGRAMGDAPKLGWASFLFACLAGLEVICAFLSASIAVSYHLFIGEVTDAVEVGVGLLFIRELSQQTYRGIRYGKTKQFWNFFIMLAVLVGLGMCLDPLSAKLFAGYVQ